jgi:hypothetical protein
MSMPAGPGWTGRLALLAAHAASWWTALAVAGVVLASLVFRLLAERSRRKTLEAAFRAPARTLVIMDKGPGGPAMWVWVGENQSSEQPEPVTWVHPSSAAQVRLRRQA